MGIERTFKVFFLQIFPHLTGAQVYPEEDTQQFILEPSVV